MTGWVLHLRRESILKWLKHDSVHTHTNTYKHSYTHTYLASLPLSFSLPYIYIYIYIYIYMIDLITKNQESTYLWLIDRLILRVSHSIRGYLILRCLEIHFAVILSFICYQIICILQKYFKSYSCVQNICIIYISSWYHLYINII